ncbi:MAG: LamG domain-containing protein [Candidatus Marsarchaeota archaeon]|nr:LamG domain-containing protein [Candidatus Marsarchaeota archaeon]
MRAAKLQIALEFMIIFAFVLVVFLFLFALVGTQRAQTSNNQLFSEEQLVAQNVAAQIDQALRAGNGYVARVPVTGSIGTLAYQLLVTKNGEVIVNATIARQVLQAYAFSTAKSVLSDSSYLQPNTFYYNLPIANGTLVIQNSYGTICVDYSCQNASGFASNVSISARVTHAALFNGQEAPVISVPFSTSLYPGYITVSAWVYINGPTANNYARIVDAGSNEQYTYWVQNNGGVAIRLNGAGNSCTGNSQIGYSPGLQDGRWYSLIFTYDGSNTELYVNGAVVNPSSCSPSSYSGPIASQSSPVTIGNGAGLTRPFNGMITNVQIYNTALTAGQVDALFNEGITGTPVLPKDLAAWWTLNGNTHDYSGNGNEGTASGPMLYPAVSQLVAKVANQAGYALANDLIGFSTTLGTFVGSNQMATNYSNANGLASAILTQQNTSGQALVKATAFNGNTSLSGNLVGWWPLSIGQGSTAYDLSGNGNEGSVTGFASWSQPNYVANFDGQSAYVAPPAISAFQPTGTVTYSGWVKPEYVSTRSSVASRCQRIIQNGADGGGGWEAEFDCGVSASPQASCSVHTSSGWSSPANSSALQLGSWYMVSCTYDSTTGKLYMYVNGQLTNASAVSGGAITYGSTAVPYIGTDDSFTNGQFFNGSIANVQVYNTALSSNQLLQLYQQGFSGEPEASSGLMGWWPLDGNGVDYSGNGRNGTIYGNLSFVAAPKSDGIASANSTGILSANFNGSSSTINVGNSNSLMPSSFTISGWAEFPSNSAWMMVDRAAGGTSGAYYIYGNYVSTGSGNGPDCVTYSSSGSRKDTFFGQLNLNTFYQLTCEFNSSTGTVKTFVNGVLINTTKGASLGQNADNVLIGNYAGGGYFTNGNYSNIQFYNTSLSLAQVSSLYREGMAGLPVTGAGLVGWWPLNGNANDYSGSGNNGTATNVIYSTQRALAPAVQTSLGGSGISLNGQNGGIATTANINLPSTLSETVSMWVNPASYSPSTSPAASNPSVGSDLFQEGYSGTANMYMINYTGRLGMDIWGCGTPRSTEPVPIGSWSYVTYVYSASSDTISYYINGNPSGTVTPCGYHSTNNPVVLGLNTLGSSDNDFNGSISDAMLYNVALTPEQVKALYGGQAPPGSGAIVPLSWFP